MAYVKFTKLISNPTRAISISTIKISRRSFSEKMNKTTETAVQIFLRRDQTLPMRNMDHYQDQSISIYTKAWTMALLRKISQTFPENISASLKVRISEEQINLKMPMALKDLIMICRNETQNVSGLIAFSQYPKQISKAAILTLKDLIRHVVILGEDETRNYGGYPWHNRVKQQQAKVILIDLIGLQFQQDYNSGRLVLIAKDLPEGLYDREIYERIVGGAKISYEQAAADTSGRYVKVDRTYFDTLAYQKIVANDFLLVCTSLNHFTKEDVNLKFLKYGTGFFAGRYRRLLEKHINKGVALGLKKVLDLNINTRIKALGFPYYEEDAEIKKLCSEHNLECVFSRDDALRRSYDDKIDATTNCADPHVVTGNEMGYGSVDAAIAENVKSNAITFSPAINREMQGFIINENGVVVPEGSHVHAESHL